MKQQKKLNTKKEIKLNLVNLEHTSNPVFKKAVSINQKQVPKPILADVKKLVSYSKLQNQPSDFLLKSGLNANKLMKLGVPLSYFIKGNFPLIDLYKLGYSFSSITQGYIENKGKISIVFELGRKLNVPDKEVVKSLVDAKVDVFQIVLELKRKYYNAYGITFVLLNADVPIDKIINSFIKAKFSISSCVWVMRKTGVVDKVIAQNLLKANVPISNIAVSFWESGMNSVDLTKLLVECNVSPVTIINELTKVGAKIHDVVKGFLKIKYSVNKIKTILLQAGYSEQDVDKILFSVFN
ncbi:MAG TPA: hypothetical protein PLN85_04375 [archaeon]|nr:hypothetical protein [archaeon]